MNEQNSGAEAVDTKPPETQPLAALDRIEKKLNGILQHFINLPEQQAQISEVLKQTGEKLLGLENLVKMLYTGLAQRDKQQAEAILETRKHFSSEVRALADALGEKFQSQAAERFILEFLPVLDDLDRILQQRERVEGDSTLSAWLDTFEAFRTKVMVTFRAAGLEAIEVRRGEEQFDPELHAAVERAEGEGGAAPGIILGIAERGYRFQGKVLRKPHVIVKGE